MSMFVITRGSDILSVLTRADLHQALTKADEQVTLYVNRYGRSPQDIRVYEVKETFFPTTNVTWTGVPPE